MRRFSSVVSAASLSCLTSFTAIAQSPIGQDNKVASAYFKGLRDKYAAAQPGTISWVIDEERKSLIKLYDEKAPEKFLEKVNHWLSKCPVDAKIQIMAASLSARAGRFEDSIRYRNMYYGLLSSIVDSGDGKTSATAFKVISVDEEYTLLNFMGADVKRQSLQGACDVMETMIEGKPVTIYFDVSIPLKAMQREFESANAK
jgi:hypothetical protein